MNNKYVGPFLAFTPDWFARHQRALLWLANAPLIRLWFRWVLRIHGDIPGNERIITIRPDSITYAPRVLPNGRLQFTTDFRTHPKFAKRLYFAFRPLWWTIHFWDWLIADRFLPQLSYGFDTLTCYPAAGNNSPVNGQVQRGGVSESFATIRGGAGNGAFTGSTTINVGLSADTTSNLYSDLRRGIALFDTSPLTASATISAATLSLKGTAKFNSLGANQLDICSSTPAADNALANSDYGQLGSTSFATVADASYSTSAYNDFTLNSNGLANISKTSLSKFGIRLGWDINNSFTGTWSVFNLTQYNFNSADATGTTNDPKLVVTYTVAGGAASPRRALIS